MRLNNKGYLAVEVILASVVAITIAVFLMEITVKLVNITDDAYVDTEIITDKTLIIKNIKDHIEEDIKNNGIITNISCNSLYCNITFNNSTTSIIKIMNRDGVDYKIQYGDYSKNINKNLYNYTISSSKSEDYVLIKITADNKFSNEPFEANIIVYNK